MVIYINNRIHTVLRPNFNILIFNFKRGQNNRLNRLDYPENTKKHEYTHFPIRRKNKI